MEWQISFFFKRIGQILKDDKNVFNLIATFNKLPKLFPTDLKKIKLNDDIKDLIFSLFSFKYITRLSSTIKIVNEIYNLYFGKFIIKCTSDGNKNMSYTIDEIFNEYYEFGKEHLLLNKESYLTYNHLQEMNDIVIEV